MRRRLPTLNALRAFEAAARNMSFRGAAEELSVTHSAISHQVKTLEDQLGLALFRRGGRSIELTEAGLIYFPVLRDAFDRMASGTELMTSTEGATLLTVQVYVSVAMRWLIPILHEFQHRYPDIQVRLNTSYLNWDFDRDSADVGIVITSKRQRGLDHQLLFEANIFPVCSPDLVTGPDAIREPKHLSGHNLLRVYTSPNDWERWLEAAGAPDTVSAPGVTVDSYILALEAAVSGHGIAMPNMMFARDDLAAGRLARPFDLSVPEEGSWYLVCAKEQKNAAKIVRFRDWLLSKIAADPDLAG